MMVKAFVKIRTPMTTRKLPETRGHVVSRVSGAVDWDDPRVRSYLKSFISSKAGF